MPLSVPPVRLDPIAVMELSPVSVRLVICAWEMQDLLPPVEWHVRLETIVRREALSPFPVPMEQSTPTRVDLPLVTAFLVRLVTSAQLGFLFQKLVRLGPTVRWVTIPMPAPGRRISLCWLSPIFRPAYPAQLDSFAIRLPWEAIPIYLVRQGSIAQLPVNQSIVR